MFKNSYLLRNDRTVKQFNDLTFTQLPDLTIQYIYSRLLQSHSDK